MSASQKPEELFSFDLKGGKLRARKAARYVHLAQIVIKIPVDSKPYFLLRWNSKWKDWGLVGGHVEPEEQGDYKATAIRESNEELVPWKHDKDFVIVPFPFRAITWGPVLSKSNGNTPTFYTSKFFYLMLLDEPRKMLDRLPMSSFVLLDKKAIDNSKIPTDGILRIVKAMAKQNHMQIPYACGNVTGVKIKKAR